MPHYIVNRILNPTFQLGTTGWAVYDNSVATVTNARESVLGSSIDRDWALRVTRTVGSAHAGAKFSSIVPSGDHNLSAYFKGDAATIGKSIVALSEYTVNGVPGSSSGSLTITGEWQRIDHSFTIPAGTVSSGMQTIYLQSAVVGDSFVMQGVQLSDQLEVQDYGDGDMRHGYWNTPASPNNSISYVEPDPYAIGSELYEQFAPLEAIYGAMPDLQIFCRGLGHAMQPIDDISKDEDFNEPGWSQVLDLSRAKPEWLRWVAQWVGYYVPTSPKSWSQERTRIVSRSAHRRGSIPLLREVIQEHLIDPNDTSAIVITERSTGAYFITVGVVGGKIATSAAEVEAAVRAQKAGGLIMTFTVLSGGTWQNLLSNHVSWTEVGTDFATWQDVYNNPSFT